MSFASTTILQMKDCKTKGRFFFWVLKKQKIQSQEAPSTSM